MRQESQHAGTEHLWCVTVVCVHRTVTETSQTAVQLEAAAAAGSSELDRGSKQRQSLCETRWSARFTNLRIVYRRLPEII